MVSLVSLVLLIGFRFQMEPLEPVEPIESLESATPGASHGLFHPIETDGTPGMEEASELLSLDAVLPEAGERYEPGTELFVTASSLAFRKGPRRDAMLFRYLKRNTKVVTLYDVLDPVLFSVDGLHGEWVYVQEGNHKGYLFNGYLASVPPSLEILMDWKCVPGERVGPISYETPYTLLEAIFGKANLSEDKFPLGEGEYEPGTAVYPGDPEKMLLIQWEVYHEVPQAVLILGSKWKTPGGIALGTRLSTLVSMNGGPVSFAGFAWDYEGFVMSWRGGALEEDHPLRSGITLNLTPQKPYLLSDYEQVKGDNEFSSDHEATSKLNLEVGSMTVMIGRVEEQ